MVRGANATPWLVASSLVLSAATFQACAGENRPHAANGGTGGSHAGGSGQPAGGTGARGGNGVSSGGTNGGRNPGESGAGGEPGGAGGSPGGTPGTTTPHLDAGWNHTCLLGADGEITCWGANRQWLEEDYTDVEGAATSQPGPYALLSAGVHTCAIDGNRKLSCFGRLGEYSARTLTGYFSAVSVGYDMTCGLRSNSLAECWNFGGRVSTPEEPFVAVSAGEGLACGLDMGGEVTCWDAAGTYMESSEGPLTGLSAGGGNVCALRENGTLVCWARNPMRWGAPPDGEFVQVSVGGSHACAVAKDGTLACWGSGPAAAAVSGTFVEVAAGNLHSCARRSDERIVCWGDNTMFQALPPQHLSADRTRYLQIAVEGNSIVKVDVGDESEPAQGWTRACALRADRTLECWGDEGSGATSPPLGTYEQVVRGACALRTDGQVDCWGPRGNPFPDGPFVQITDAVPSACGIRRDGQLACSTLTPPAGTFTTIVTAGAGACAVRSDGAIVCFGAGERVVEGSFVEVALGWTTWCAIDTAGSVLCWERGTTTSEVLEGEFSGLFNGCALRLDGGVFCHDIQQNGWLVTDERYRNLSVAVDYACGIKVNGDLGCFGSRVR